MAWELAFFEYLDHAQLPFLSAVSLMLSLSLILHLPSLLLLEPSPTLLLPFPLLSFSWSLHLLLPSMPLLAPSQPFGPCMIGKLGLEMASILIIKSMAGIKDLNHFSREIKYLHKH
jgi:hypothetical protein